MIVLINLIEELCFIFTKSNSLSYIIDNLFSHKVECLFSWHLLASLMSAISDQAIVTVSCCLQLDYAAINFCHNHPPRTPGDLHQKFAPNMGLFHLNFCPRAGIFWGKSRGGGGGHLWNFCHFWNFHCYPQELATHNTLRFNICCTEILYVFLNCLNFKHHLKSLSGNSAIS